MDIKLLKVDTISQVKDKLEDQFSTYFREERGIQWETVPISEAVGRFLAHPVTGGENIPAFNRSVVDGYAVAAADTCGAGPSIPVFLDMAGEVEMGTAKAIRLKMGQAVSIPTGGALPEGADSVVMAEYAELLDSGTVAVYKSAAPGEGVVRAGEDIEAGRRLYDRGHQIREKDIGVFAALGYAGIDVFFPPGVALISTGDEVVAIEKKPGPGQVRDINTHTISALLRRSGARVKESVLLKDEPGQLRQALRKALRDCDIVLISGGSSAGVKDITAELIDEAGRPGVITHGIAMKPGKPTIIGVIRAEEGTAENGGNHSRTERPRLAVGLPGHPAAAVVSYLVVVDYFIKRYWFASEQEERKIPAVVTQNIHAGEGRETFIMVKLLSPQEYGGPLLAQPIYAKSASVLQLAQADGYVRMSDMSEGIAAGETAEITLFW